MTTTGKANDPTWWNAEHESGWQKVRHSLKEGLSKMKSAAGGKPAGQAGSGQSGLGDSEPAVRYGYGAGHQYGAAKGAKWTALEPKLQKEWETLGTGREWTHARGDVMRGWDSHTRHLHGSDVAPTVVREGASGLGDSSAGDSGSGEGPF
jgi:hypothetical protein